MMKTYRLFLLSLIITIIIGFTTPADATQRLKYTGIARSTGGAVLGSATVTIYLAGTTTPANVYEASTGGDSVTSVTSDSNGRWTFYADVADYAFTQEYKVVVTKDGYSSITLDNIFNLSLPTDAAGFLYNDGSGNYSWGSSLSDADIPNTLTISAITLADDGELPLPAALPEVDSFFKIASDGTMSFVAISDYSGIPSYGELTTEHVAVWYDDDGTWKLKAGDLPATDNTTNGKLVKKVVTAGVHTMEDASAGTDYAAPNADTTGTASKLPVDTATDAEGEESADGTTGQLRYYVNGVQRVHSPIKTFSVVIPSVADTDDMFIMKAPYGMTLTAIDCIVSVATSATINIQECGADGTSCSDTATSDLACDTDNANTTTFSNAVIDSGDWIKLDVASISGTPGTLSVTVTYTIVAD